MSFVGYLCRLADCWTAAYGHPPSAFMTRPSGWSPRWSMMIAPRPTPPDGIMCGYCPAEVRKL
jgi:hypothetical protein